MNEQEMLLELYKICVASKDRFIERAFGTNKFYLITSIIILVVTSIALMKIKYLLLTICLSGMGVFICALWWFNEDSYSYLLSIKYRYVLDVIEEKLPFAPGVEEFKAIQERKKKKGVFVFQNSQKLLITIIMLIFVVFLLAAILPFYQSMIWR
ncbi:hypothetical protein IKQ26_06965 [bacterium]|nr:hypothetical protein [bacterium]